MWWFILNVYANNLTITNVSLTKPDSANSTITVQFDISWDNSWRNYINYDAVWVFVKYSCDSGQTWQHATLKSGGVNPNGFSQGTGTNIDLVVPEDKKGCFIYRSSIGAGRVEVRGIQLLWDWEADKLEANDTVVVKVFGIEMVYIPPQAFYIGDGDGTNESTNAFHLGTGSSSVRITDKLVKDVRVEENIYDDSQLEDVGIGIDGDEGIDVDNDGIVDNKNFPTGYLGFYCMKYEITEGQWVDFFNTLTPAQKINRDITGPDGKNSDDVVNRNTISWSTGEATTLRPDRALNYISWMDLCAFADWAALRPMTELEFEKIARGPNEPIVGEYAWGDTTIIPAKVISGVEDGRETITNVGANSCYNDEIFSGGDGGKGPLRVGIFATARSNRITAGAGYYGVMELSGNVEERCVTVGNTTGRNFQGTHGDGMLSLAVGYEGNATNPDWPGYQEGKGVCGATGSGFRGGSWEDTVVSRLAISNRSRAAQASGERRSDSGGRCVRTAPRW